MAIHGKATGVLIGGEDPTRFLTDYTVSAAVEVAETTGFQMQAKEYTVGQSDATVSFSGRYQGSKNDAEKVFERVQDNADGDPFYIGTNGWLAGSRCRFGTVLRTGFDVSASLGDVVGTSLSLQATGGVGMGWCLGRGDIGVGAYPSFVADTDEDGLANWSQGTWAQLHVLRNDLSQDSTIVVQHSTDNATWVDIPDLTFTLPAGKRLGVSKRTTTALRRYVRTYIIVPNGTTGSANVAEAVARI